MKVVIVGCGARSFQWPEGAEVWVINHAAQMYSHQWSRWFHLHGREHISWAEKRTPYGSQIEYMVATDKPVYVPDPTNYPRCHIRKFPYPQILGKYGTYFNNSFPLLLVYALEEGATEVWLDGVQYGRDAPAEAWAVPCIEHWIGFLRGRGVEVHVPKASGLCEWDHVYGLEGPGSV